MDSSEEERLANTPRGSLVQFQIHQHVMKDLSKTYKPLEVEKQIYEKWEESGFFNPDNLPENQHGKFCSIMPPPNANGRLHAGHALDMTLKDIIVRFERMRGKKTLLLPGADHAGFETQMVFEKKLSKEGRSRFNMKDEDLYKEIWDFTMENKKYMEDDIRKLGISCDWSRQMFTLDKFVVEQVQKTFIKMYEDGLVYRGERIVNWNPKYKTALSDIEVEYIEKTDPFYYIQYGPFVISTVRPETKFGDKYVVMHPKDKRYQQYKHGEKIELEWINGSITATIIKDEAIDMEFGTGVMTITPWHDQTDFEIAERHKLDKEQIIDFDGRLLPIAGEFGGMKIEEARPKIIEKLASKGLLVRVDQSYTHNIAVCERTQVPIEPQIKKQWFVKMEPLAKMVIDAVEKEQRISIIPEHQKKVLLHWMHNTIDWNISRQIAWGIPIPAWFNQEEVRVGFESPGQGWEKDPDTFDTWFSSGQWPLLTLKYPDGPDFKDYYPTELMESGSDLVFKWIPRMIMFGLYLTNEIPFKTIYFHGMVNDEKNQKMSKSKGNVISPIDMGEKYGTDALRMALVVGNTPGNSIALSEDKIRAYKHFANKLWNISRFIISNTLDTKEDEMVITETDKQLIAEFDQVLSEITSDLSKYRLHTAAEKCYHYAWHRLADQILEESKPVLNGNSLEEKTSRQQTLIYILKGLLKTLHPFMPFVTEHIWSLMYPNSILMIQPWPTKQFQKN